ncbi:MAG: hypothetical protein ABFR95_04600 [Actinomycetota bacterium]
MDILLPATDAGVFFQIGLLVAVVATGSWLARKNRDVQRLVFGLGLLTFALMTIRAIH